MNGLFSASVNSFHSAPRRLLISELCIFGLSCAILRRWPRDHTMKAFMGRFTRSSFAFDLDDPVPPVEAVTEPEPELRLTCV